MRSISRQTGNGCGGKGESSRRGAVALAAGYRCELLSVFLYGMRAAKSLTCPPTPLPLPRTTCGCAALRVRL